VERERESLLGLILCFNNVTGFAVLRVGDESALSGVRVLLMQFSLLLNGLLFHGMTACCEPITVKLQINLYPRLCMKIVLSDFFVYSNTFVNVSYDCAVVRGFVCVCVIVVYC